MRKPIDKELAIALEEAIYPRRAGEWEAKKYLRANGADVEDVSNNPAYWKKDIDLIADGVSIEVKWDGAMATTGNIFIETCSDIDKISLVGLTFARLINSTMEMQKINCFISLIFRS